MNVGTLYELLDRLPERCDYFTVRFTTHDRSVRIDTDGWTVNDNGQLLLTLNDDYANEYNYTVDSFKGLLAGYCNDRCEGGQEIYDYQEMYVVTWPDDFFDDTTWYNILDDRFEINWKRERVDVFIKFDS